MPKSETTLSREEIAMHEAGRTHITTACAALLMLVFLAVILAAPLIQALASPRNERSVWPALVREMAPAWRTASDMPPGLRRVARINRRLLAAMDAWETALEDDAMVGQWVRPPVQYLLARWLGAGNEQAYCGRGAWLFFRPDVDFLVEPGFLDPGRLARRAAEGREWDVAPQPDPRPALLDLHTRLRERNIELLLVPVPVKTMIHPDRFTRAFDAADNRPQNASYDVFVAELLDAGINIFDVTAALAAPGMPVTQYLATDTHWRPQAMQAVAAQVARFIREQGWLPEKPPVGYTIEPEQVTGRGDIAAMLRLPEWQSYYAPETVALERVHAAHGGLWQSDPQADVLVLGDSFCNIYSLASMGWGEAAGFVEHLSHALQRPLDRIAINDNAAFAARALLRREMARGRDRLAGKRLVIYQFAMRELAYGDWRVLDLELGRPPLADFIRLAPGETRRVRGLVNAVSSVPRPGSVPYRDHLISLHLVDVESDGSGSQALVYAWSMRDNVLTDAAACRPGETVEILLQSWDDVAGELDRLNRSELDQWELQLQDPCWAAEIRRLGFELD